LEGPAITISVVYNDEEVLKKYLHPSLSKLQTPVSTIELNNEGNLVTTNIASLYNTFLQLSGPDLIAFLHPDVSFEHTFVDDVRRAIEHIEKEGNRWGAMGIVGRNWRGEYVWCHQIDEPTLVCCLDSCSLITNRKLGMRFDQRWFNEFHCYVEDYCLQCHDRRLGVYVFPARAAHGSATKSVKGSQWGRYRIYRKMLAIKWWRRFRPIYTC
jgi:hypothetical protein